MVKRGEVWLARLDPTVGHEIQKTRPCVIISPDELNATVRTVIIAPMTTGGWATSFRIPITFEQRSGLIVPDQMRSVDRQRLRKRLGMLADDDLQNVLGVVRATFEV